MIKEAPPSKKWIAGLLQATQPKQLQAAVSGPDVLINKPLNRVLSWNRLALSGHKAAVFLGVKLLG